jgi:hypothetical protein
MSISLTGNGGRTVNFEVTDLVGRTLLSRKVNNWSEGPYEVNISTLPEGPYFVRLQQENGRRCKWKVIEQD